MDISREEQRVLHALAQGGAIHATKTPNGKVVAVECLNRDGWLVDHCNLRLFRKLKSKGAIASSAGRPYRITRRGLERVRTDLANRWEARGSAPLAGSPALRVIPAEEPGSNSGPAQGGGRVPGQARHDACGSRQGYPPAPNAVHSPSG